MLAGPIDPHPGRGAVALEVLEDGTHRDVVRFEDAGVADVLTTSSWLESKVSEGGTASVRVRAQLALARQLLAD